MSNGKNTESLSVKTHFSDFFTVSPDTIKKFGAFNVSLINDLPLFIDPFLLFNSDKPEYRKLHDQIIGYVRFLKDVSLEPGISQGLLDHWFLFPEVKQNWLGYSAEGNRGSGLGREFARALNHNLHNVFNNFGEETITKGSHLEKLCLISNGVGRDHISDFTTNQIKDYLLNYTQHFAKKYLANSQRKAVRVSRVHFNYDTRRWESAVFELPYLDGDYVILTPKDMLTKDESWINRGDLFSGYHEVEQSIPNEQLRAQINAYFLRNLPVRANTKERAQAIAGTIKHFPEILDYYIRRKEDTGDTAVSVSQARVKDTEVLFIQQIKSFVADIRDRTDFYQRRGDTFDEAMERVRFLKDVIENQDGYRVFYLNGKPIHRETDLHIMYRLTWFATLSDVNREVNNGRGPVDFKISRGNRDKTLVEFKLASNSQLKRNLKNQVGIYERASGTKKSIKVILYFSETEYQRVRTILRELKLEGMDDIVLIDAGRDQKLSASKAWQGVEKPLAFFS